MILGYYIRATYIVTQHKDDVMKIKHKTLLYKKKPEKNDNTHTQRQFQIIKNKIKYN